MNNPQQFLIQFTFKFSPTNHSCLIDYCVFYFILFFLRAMGQIIARYYMLPSKKKVLLLLLSCKDKMQGHSTSIFRKYLFGRRFEIQNFRNICSKISCLPASPRIFEHLKNGIIANFQRIFTLKRSPRIFGSLFFWLKFSKR